MRVAGLRFFPSAPEAQEELVKALVFTADDEASAEQIITDWLRRETEAPTPAHIYQEKLGTADYYEVPEL